MSMTIAELIEESHATAVAKGWWETDRPFSEGIALMHSELSEALEEWRKYGVQNLLYYLSPCVDCGKDFPVNETTKIPERNIYECTSCNHPHNVGDLTSQGKPEGIAVEFADVLIRIADWCGKHNIPLEEALRAKMVYNKTRPHRHGGKLA